MDFAPRQILAIAKAIQTDVPRPESASQAPNDSTQSDLLSLFEAVVTDPKLRHVTHKLFADGHYARAVEEAFKCLNNEVKQRTGLQADGADLMRTALSEKKPLIRLNGLRTPSDVNEQNGYRDILAGSMTGIRNPRAHEHELQDHPERAIELLTLANHLMRNVHGATRTRTRRNDRSQSSN